jgi:hypothetical protein
MNGSGFDGRMWDFPTMIVTLDAKWLRGDFAQEPMAAVIFCGLPIRDTAD